MTNNTRQDKSRDASNGQGARPWYHTAGSKVWYFFNSLKLTLFVLITLAVLSVVGTVIQQNLPVEDYVKAYGEKWARVILYTRIYDMYHAFWFLIFLAALALNIIVCTFERFPPKWKSLLYHKSDKFDPKIIDRLAQNATLTLNAPAGEVRDRLLRAFKSKRYKVLVTEDKGAYNVYAWKGIIGRFGSDVTHISLLLILLGAIIGSYYGYKDFRAVYVGNSLNLSNEKFEVRLNKFWIDYYDSGQIKQYNSSLTVIEDGKEVLTKQIWVNEPLFYKGVRFYQSSYGMAWNQVSEAHIALKKKSKSGTEAPVKIRWDSSEKLPGTDYTVKLVGYVADFAFDEKTRTVFSQSPEANNPAVNLEVYKGATLVSTPWLFLKYPGAFPAIPNSDDDLVFITFKPVMYSGLSINKDPGTNVVWAGAAVMGIGFYLAFFVYHRRAWAVVKNTGKSTELKIGGMTNKNSFVFERDLKDITDDVTSG